MVSPPVMILKVELFLNGSPGKGIFHLLPGDVFRDIFTPRITKAFDSCFFRFYFISAELLKIVERIC